MSLNIKNEKVHALARAAAELTGKTQTAVIEEALESYIAGHVGTAEEAARQHRLDLVFADIKRDMTDELRARMQQVEDSLYDAETGLPA